MKTKKLIPVLLLLFFMSAYSQSPVDKKNIVKTNLTAYIFRNYNLTYERSLTSWLSIAVSYGKIPEGEVPLLNKFLKKTIVITILMKQNSPIHKLLLNPVFI